MRKQLLVGLVILSLIYMFATPDTANAQESNIIKVYYAGPQGGATTAINLAKFTVVNDPELAQVFFLNDTLPTPDYFRKRILDGAGLVLILGPNITAKQIAGFLDTPIQLEERINPLSLSVFEGLKDKILTDIIWTGAPQIRDRDLLSISIGNILQPLVIGYEDQSLILGKGELGKGTVFIFTPFISGKNPQIQDWVYFNYLIYHLVMRAAGLTPLAFADYPASPVPHSKDQAVIFVIMGVLIIISFGAYWKVRRYSLAHPERLDSLVSNLDIYREREAKTSWEEIGFHRPLGGFLLALMLGLIMFIPLIIYQNLILPVYILPSAQALGIWGRVTQFFNFAWAFFDMGTSIAFIKYISEYRVHDPRKGIQYGQVFVWWQALSGAIQVALVVLIASTYAPHTAFAMYAWSVIIHAFIQIPGFYQVFRHVLTGLQRFDYAQILDMVGQVLLLVILQPIIVAVFYTWGKTNPVFGSSMGGLLGLGVSAYAIELGTFLLGLWLYNRLGYNGGLLFLAHFDWEVIKNSFRFGVFEMLGSIAWSVGQAAEIWITQARLMNYAEIWGNWGLAQNFIFSYQVIQTLFNDAMPSISEAISHGRIALSQYYTVQTYKYGGMISSFIGAVLLAVADRFILGASGPEFTRAATYAIPLIIWGAIQYPSWVGDNVQLATNRPYLKSILVTGEQIIRIILALILLRKLQIIALILAYFVGLLIKDFVAYFINHKTCFPQRFYIWQSFVAPLLAGAIHYLLLRWFTGLIWKQDQITSVLIFFIGILLSFPIYTFFYALFGGWDDDTLEELKKGAKLSNFMAPLSWIFWASSALGARLSPIHGRFPIDIRQSALLEARSLQDEKVKLEAVGGKS